MIEQHIGTVPTLPTPPSLERINDFDNDGALFADGQKAFGEALNQRATELNTAFEQVNEVATELNVAKEATLNAQRETEQATATALLEITEKVNESASSAQIATQQKELAILAKEEALQAAIDAKAALDYFDDRYLGAKDISPTTDNDGDPLKVGAVYWDTNVPDHNLRTWNGTSWQDYGIGVIAGVASVNGRSGNVNLTTVDIAGLEEFKSNLEHFVLQNVTAYATQLKFN